MDVQFRGRRVIRRAGTTREAAREALAAARLDLELWALGRSPIHGARRTLAAMLMTWHDARGSTLRTADRAAHMIAHVRASPLAAEDPTAPDPRAVLAYLAQRREARASDGTIRRERAVIRAAIRWSMEAGIIPPAPVPQLAALAPRTTRALPVRALPLTQAKALAERAPRPLRTLILAALTTGLRAGDLLALDREALDLVENRIRIQTQKTGALVTLPILAPLRAELDELDDPQSLGALGWSVNRLGHAFTRHAHRCGIHGARFHDLRHTFATAMRAAGIPLDELAPMLGHASPSTTARYAHAESPARERIEGALSALSSPA